MRTPRRVSAILRASAALADASAALAELAQAEQEEGRAPTRQRPADAAPRRPRIPQPPRRPDGSTIEVSDLARARAKRILERP